MVVPVAGQTPVTDQFVVNSTVSGYQFSPSIASNASGNRVIVWSSQLGSSSSEGIFLQRFDGAGARVGSQTRVDDPAFVPFTNSKKRDPAVAIDDAGNFLVVWAAGIFSFGTQFDYFFDVSHIYGQRFSAAGVAQGPNFLVDNGRNGPQEWPSVAMFASGEAVVAWSAFGDGSNKGIWMQRFDASGTRLGVTGFGCFDYLGFPAICDSPVNTFTTGYQAKPRVAANVGTCAGGPIPGGCTLGDFVVVWEGAGPGDGAGIFAQVFSGTNGFKSGSQFLVNTYTNNTQELASVSMDASGNFIVTWIGEAVPSGRGVFGQRFGIPTGPCPVGCVVTFGPLGPEFQVASLLGGSNHFNRASVGKATTGGFVVVWNDVDNSSSNDAIFGRDYDEAGAALGSQFQVSAAPATYYRPAVAMSPMGQFMVTWEGGNDGGGDFGIWARRFAPVAASDTTPPVITPNISGTLGANGWYTSNVTVTWTVTDPDSPVTSPPCGSSTVIADTAGVTFTCTATSGGGTNSISVTIKRDATAPSAILTASGTLGSNGWYVTDVTISTSGADTVSSPVVCTADQTLTTDTTGQTFTGSCTNDAGLSMSALPLTIKRDATGPSASLAVTAGTLGSGGWYVSDVTISTSGIDTVSGPVSCTADQTLAIDTAGQVFSGSCTNSAGLLTNAPSLTIKRDMSPPSATLAVTTGTLGNNGWFVTDVTVSTMGTDNISNPVTCTAPQSQTTDTSGRAFAGSCTNAAGLSASATSLTVKVDRTAPTIAINAPTNGASYTLNQLVAANYACVDALSGMTSCAGTVASGANIDTASAGGKTFTVTAVDAAGNSTTQSVGYDVVGPVPVDEQLRSLGALISGVGAPPGTTRSLLAKLGAVQSSVARGNTTSACNQLSALIHEVQAQSGKKLTVDEADAIIAAAEQLSSALGCP